MRSKTLCAPIFLIFAFAPSAFAQPPSRILPHRGVIARRTGVGGEEFGITLALAMPDKWNGDFLMQGGGGSNGVVPAPLGLNAAGHKPGLIRGFAVASTDTGHESHRAGFDFGFMRDQHAYLDFAYLANAEVATLAKQLIAQHYGKPAAFSYFSGCSTGGREGMILFAALSHAFQRHHLWRSRSESLFSSAKSFLLHSLFTPNCFLLEFLHLRITFFCANSLPSTSRIEL